MTKIKTHFDEFFYKKLDRKLDVRTRLQHDQTIIFFN